MLALASAMPLQAKLTSLSVALRQQRDTILNDWLKTLRIGKEKPGAALSDEQLRDHFGELLEDLCNQLEVPLTEESEISALRHAEVHGDLRWAQGYKLPELIREIAALRTVVVAAVVQHGHAHFDLRVQSLANIIVHRFFDALVVESVSFFATLAQDAATLLQRQQLAQELHDSACQTLQGAVMKLAVASARLDPELKSEFDGVTALLTQGLRDVRSIVHGLVAEVRDFEQGLPAALAAFGAQLSGVVPCAVVCDPGVSVPAKHAFQLFRIVQEAANNACKHAQPGQITISLTATDTDYRLQVHDNGRGFDSTQKAPGIGLFNMQQRARAIGAELRIESSSGTGTTVTCVLAKSALNAPRTTPPAAS